MALTICSTSDEATSSSPTKSVRIHQRALILSCFPIVLLSVRLFASLSFSICYCSHPDILPRATQAEFPGSRWQNSVRTTANPIVGPLNLPCAPNAPNSDPRGVFNTSTRDHVERVFTLSQSSHPTHTTRTLLTRWGARRPPK